MAAFAAQGMPLSGDQLQPEVVTFLDWLEGKATLDFRGMPSPSVQIYRAMEREFQAHYRPTPLKQDE